MLTICRFRSVWPDREAIHNKLEKLSINSGLSHAIHGYASLQIVKHSSIYELYIIILLRFISRQQIFICNMNAYVYTRGRLHGCDNLQTSYCIHASEAAIINISTLNWQYMLDIVNCCIWTTLLRIFQWLYRRLLHATEWKVIKKTYNRVGVKF